MAHISRSTVSAGERLLEVAADPDTQVDGLERLEELAKHASRKEHTIDVIIQSCRTRSMSCKG